ncbi:MAG: hypothetical protein LBS54_07885 [Dysgonamonadaceae bacterium]|nr:hypothetical protein [Dysgonamonadaceae bacterium]
MATYLKFILLIFNEKKDGKSSVSLRVTKNRKRKYLKNWALCYCRAMGRGTGTF